VYWVLENHVFLDPEIERSIAARDVFFIGDAQLRAFSSCATPSSFLLGAHGQEF
jgi:hypothetical protein